MPIEKIVLIDLDNTSLDFTGEKRKQYHPIERPFPQGRKGFYRNLPAIEGAVAAIHAIENDPQYKVYFCTAPSMSLLNTFCLTEKAESVIHTFGEKFYHRLIFTFDKSMIQGDYLIDDLPQGRGQDRFKGDLLVFGSPCYPNWCSILERLNVHEQYRRPLIDTYLDDLQPSVL